MDEGFCVAIVFLDLVQAFDKVPHLRLMEKLKKRGIGGKLLRSIGNWLGTRRQRVCVQWVMSLYIQVTVLEICYSGGFEGGRGPRPPCEKSGPPVAPQ